VRSPESSLGSKSSWTILVSSPNEPPKPSRKSSGTPITSRTSVAGGLDALLSIAQMRVGVPVATVAIAGARNAGLLAVRILATADPALPERVRAFQAQLAESARPTDAHVRTDPDTDTDNQGA